MESMILVAGLAIAGLAVIAAAFYSGARPETPWVRTIAEPDRSGDGRFDEGRGGGSRPSSSRTARSSSSARPAADSGPQGRTRGTQRKASTGPMRSASTGSMASAAPAPAPARVPVPVPVPAPEARADRRADAERYADAGIQPDSGGQDSATSRSWRVGWRKAADLDEELWPAEAFGGVSDEQFWDDLAADKPLATTARTAQAGRGARRQPAQAGTSAPGRPAQAGAGARRHPVRASNGAPRQPAQAGAGVRRELAEDYPAPRPGPADRTAIQPALQPIQAAAARFTIATQAFPAGMQAYPVATQAPAAPAQAYPVATQAPAAAAQAYPVATQAPAAAAQAYPVATQAPAAAAQTLPAAAQPARAGRPPAVPRVLRSVTSVGVGADEDPLTSPAYCLRHQGAVDGRSDQRSDPLRAGGYQADPVRPDSYGPVSSAAAGMIGATAGQPGSRSAGRHAASAAFPFPWQPYSLPTQSTDTPPYGYQHAVGPAGDPGRANGNRGQGRPGGNGQGNWAAHPAYPPANGYRSPYDSRGNGRR
jgi:hypothetical protein